MLDSAYDVLIIGSGASGGTVARQLTQKGIRCLMLNAGPAVDFQRDRLNADDLRRAASGLLQAGCSQTLLTLITDEWPALTNRIRQFSQRRLIKRFARLKRVRHNFGQLNFLNLRVSIRDAVRCC